MDLYNNVVLLPIEDIKKYEFNPRKNDKTIEFLMEMIQKVGFNVPILVDRDNTIIKGHTRYEACKRLGMTVIPCIISQDTYENAKLDRITDNSIHDLSTWDKESLMSEMRDITDRIPDIDKLLGIDQDYSGDMFESHTETVAKDFQDAREDFQSYVDSFETKDEDYVEISCPDCGETLYVAKKQLQRVLKNG